MKRIGFQLTLRRMLGWVAVVSLLMYVALEPFPARNPLINFLVGASFSSVFGVAAARRPWLSLVVGPFLWNCVPQIDHGWNAGSLSIQGSAIGWLIGAPAGWYSRIRRSRRHPVTDPDEFERRRSGWG